MPAPLFRFLMISLLLLVGGLAAPASETQFSERGSTDFDRFLQVLNSYGTWSKIDGRWAYTPLDHSVPYTNGRWLYTEFGWYWKGNAPYSWAAEHYGFWKKGADKVWSWYPGAFWLPSIVEFRQTPTYIGWRSGEVDEDGNYVEAPEDRYAKTDEWTFCSRAQFASPITPKVLADPDTAMRQLVDSTDCMHSYFTYRAMTRIGPHPADFVTLCKDGGMFAPKTLQDKLAEQMAASPPPTPVIPWSNSTASATNAPGAAASYAAKMSPVPKPQLIGADEDEVTDKRKVKYWITMSLPTYWTKPPADAKSEEIYMYRPDIFQDSDGIQRRVTLWFNPKARTTLKDILASSGPAPASSSANKSSADIPAEPVRSTFASPLDEGYHSGSAPHQTNGASSKSPQAPAPAGLINQSAPLPPPPANTNQAPEKP